jgi:SSS family solute:Na+ symporter
MGMMKMTIQTLVGGNNPVITSPDWIVAIGKHNFLYATGWLALMSAAITVVVSLLTPAPDEQKIVNLTYATATAEQKKENRESWNYVDVLWTAAVLGLVAGMYLYFSFWLN